MMHVISRRCSRKERGFRSVPGIVPVALPVVFLIVSLAISAGPVSDVRADPSAPAAGKAGPGAQQAQDIAAFKKAHAQFLKFFAARAYDRAETEVKTALRLARKLLGNRHLITATQAHNLAVLYVSTRRYKLAVPLFREALAVRKSLLKKGDERILSSLRDLQTALFALERPGEEKAVLLQMQPFYEGTPPQNPKRLAFVLDRLGVIAINAGQLAEAEPLVNRAIELYAGLYGRRQKDMAMALSNLAVIRSKQKRLQEALTLFDEVYATRKALFGDNHQLTLQTLTEIAEISDRLNQHDRAIRLARELVERHEKRLGADHGEMAGKHNRLAAYAFRGKDYDLAGRALVRAIDITTKNEGEDSPQLLVYLSNAATLFEDLGQYAKALPLYRRRLAILEKRDGKAAPQVVDALLRLGRLSRQLARYEQSETWFKTALSREQGRAAPRKKRLRDIYSHLGGLYRETARYDESASAYRKALAAHLSAADASADNLARLYDNIGVLNIDIQRYDLAEEFHKKALALFEETLGPRHRSVALSLNNLATVYGYQGRSDEALKLQERALALYRKTARPADTRIGVFHDNLASSYRRAGRLEEAQEQYEKAMQALLKAYGPRHPEVALAMSNLAALHGERGDLEGAGQLYQKAIAINEKVFGKEHPSLADFWRLLGDNEFDRKNYDTARKHYQRALLISEKVNGADHARTGFVAYKLAKLYLWQQNYPQALTHYRRAARIEERESARKQVNAGREKREGRRGVFLGLAITTWHIASNKTLLRQLSQNRDALMDEGFYAAQKALRTSAGAALAQMAARFAAGSGQLAAKVRQRQDLTRRYGKLDKKLLQLVAATPARRDDNAIAALRTALKKAGEKIETLDRELEADFPDYASLASPRPLDAAKVQSQLRGDEAVLYFMTSNQAVYVWTVTREKFSWHRVPLKRSELRRQVAHLRQALDPTMAGTRAVKTAVKRIATRGFAADPVAGPVTGPVDTSFDLAASHGLYKTLLAPLEGLIRDKAHLIIVASDALTGLPFQVLVTEPPDLTGKDESEVYQKAAWLIRRHALTTLPDMASLTALRQLARRGKAAPKPLLAFGDPVFSKAKKPRAVADNSAGFSSFFRGGQVNLAALSKLSQLPDTRDELVNVARSLNVPVSELKLGRAASERAVKEMDRNGELAAHRIVYFATHGLVSGDIEGLGEPALALSLPRKATREDDGLLTASEVTQLRLNADWVVLSACNTASGDKPGAEALSGLARAFFYAGAKSMLVSHWPVYSDAATALTTRAFKIIEDGRATRRPVGRAEALRRSMLALMRKKNDDFAAHPSYWAPFVVVGEGAVLAPVLTPAAP